MVADIGLRYKVSITGGLWYRVENLADKVKLFFQSRNLELYECRQPYTAAAGSASGAKKKI